MVSMRGRQVVLPQYKIAFFTVPKCASMSIAYTCQAELGKEWGKIPVSFPDQPVLWDGWEEYDRYAIVRDPVDRFLSGHAFCTKEDVNELLDKVVSLPDHEIDQHFRSQASFLHLDGELIPNKLIRFENLPDAWPLEWPLHHRNATSEKAKLARAQVKALRKRFACDEHLRKQA